MNQNCEESKDYLICPQDPQTPQFRAICVNAAEQFAAFTEDLLATA
jgi:hypothetical protein